MKINAQLHSILTFAGIDPVAFVLQVAERDPFSEEMHRNSAREILAVSPGIGIAHMNVGMWNGMMDLFSLTASDAGGRIEIMRIGDSENVTFTQNPDATTPFGLVKGGPRDLRTPRTLDAARQPAIGKPAWMLDTSGQTEVLRYLGSDRITIRCRTAYVEIDVVVPDPYAAELPVAA